MRLLTKYYICCDEKVMCEVGTGFVDEFVDVISIFDV